jgi:hypothetical protein
MAIAMGFASVDDLLVQGRRLGAAIQDGEPLTPTDWRRALLATEDVFASDVVGSGLDWSITTGFSDVETIGLLRSTQRKMPRWRDTWQFRLDPDGHAVINDQHRDR